MAGNKTIFDLPLRTGVTSDDRLAIVDSGNTLTSSVKVSDLRDGTGVNSLESLTGDITFSGTNIDISTSGQTIILSGSTGGGGGEFIAGDGANSVVNDWIATSATTSPNSAIINSSGSTINGTEAVNGVIIGGESNNLLATSVGRGQENSAIVGGEDNSINLDDWNGIFVGLNNNIGEGDYSVILGGQDGSMLRGSSAIVGGFSHYLYDAYSGIFAGYNNTMAKFSDGNQVILGGENNTIRNNRFSDNRFILGGENNFAEHGNGGVIGGNGNSQLHSGSVVIGGASLSTSQDNEVVVPKLRFPNYASLNFANDGDAATGGVLLGEVYHHNGDVKIRVV